MIRPIIFFAYDSTGKECLYIRLSKNLQTVRKGIFTILTKSKFVKNFTEHSYENTIIFKINLKNSPDFFKFSRFTHVDYKTAITILAEK